MLTPYAITRAGVDAGGLTDHLGRSLGSVEAFGLALLFGEPIGEDAAGGQPAEAFMETVSAIHEHFPCVPVRLDEPLADETAGRRLLETGADRFARLLDRLADADEWSVLVEAPAEAAGLVTASARAGAGPDAMPERPESGGGRSYLRRRRRDLDTASGIHPDVSDLLADFARTLAPLARDTRTLPARGGGGSLALLVDRDREIARAFRSAAADAPLPCVLSGPWPPFSFVSLTA